MSSLPSPFIRTRAEFALQLITPQPAAQPGRVSIIFFSSAAALTVCNILISSNRRILSATPFQPKLDLIIRNGT